MEAKKNTVSTPYLKFYELEKEMNLFSLKYRGVYYWQLARVVFLEKISLQRFSISCQAPKRNYIQEILGAVKETYRMHKRRKQIGLVDIVRLRIGLGNSDGSVQNDLRYDYLHFDEKVKFLDLYCLPYYWNAARIVTYSAAPAELKTVFWKARRKLFGAKNLPQEQQALLQQFLTRINEIYHTDFTCKEVVDTIQYVVNTFIQYQKFYRDIFKRCSPKVLFLDQHYGDKQFPAIAAAKELGIKVVEFEHGSINGHKAFWYEDHSEEGKILPDYFLVYGQWWKEQTNMPPFVKVLSLGSPYMEQQVQKYPENKQRKQKTITFFSNIISGLDILELIENNYDVLTRLNYRIIFKLHPQEVTNGWRNEYPYLVEHPEIEVVENESVYKLFAESDIVMGITSTVFFEALLYDHLKIALLTKEDCSEIRPLLDNGSAIGIAGSEDFVKLLEATDKDTKPAEVNKEIYWSKNAHDNTVEFIMSLLES